MQREYSVELFKYMRRQARNAAPALNALKGFYRPKSVVDVGCGIGGWIKTAKSLFDLSDDDVLGIDGSHVPAGQLLIPKSRFRCADLDEPLSFDRKFDLAICCEVAQHVAPERAKSFIDDLTAASDVVLFSAAMPFQGGTHHVNEQWPEYWGILFRACGFVAYDVIRDIVWNDDKLDWFYRQTLLVFARPAVGDRLFGAAKATANVPLTRIHPYMFLTVATKFWPNMYGKAYGKECEHWRTLTNAYTSGATKIPFTPMTSGVMVQSWWDLKRADLEKFHKDAPSNSRIHIDNPVIFSEAKLERYSTSRKAALRSHLGELWRRYVAARFMGKPFEGFRCYENSGVMIPLVPGLFSDEITKSVRWGTYEQHEAAMLGPLIQPGEVILEIGAGCGFISTYCARNPHTKSVFCVEANPNLIKAIKLTHRVNSVDVTVFNEVLGKEDGETDFYVHSDFWASGTHSFLGAPIRVKKTSFQSRLDEIRPTMLIVDIEGGEETLFESVNLQGVKKIMLEFHQPTIGRRGMKKVFDLLSAQDFHYDIWHSFHTVVTFSHVDR